VGDREILATYLNSEPKNTSETDIFPHGTKPLLTSVMSSVISISPSVRSSVHTEKLGYRWKNFDKIFRKSVDSIQFSLKSDKNKGYST